MKTATQRARQDGGKNLILWCTNMRMTEQKSNGYAYLTSGNNSKVGRVFAEILFNHLYTKHKKRQKAANDKIGMKTEEAR